MDASTKVTASSKSWPFSDEVTRSIFIYAQDKPMSITRLRVVCKYFNELIDKTDHFWRPFVMPSYQPTTSWKEFSRNRARVFSILSAPLNLTLLTRSLWAFPISLSPTCVFVKDDNREPQGTFSKTVYCEDPSERPLLDQAIASYQSHSYRHHAPYYKDDPQGFIAGTHRAVALKALALSSNPITEILYHENGVAWAHRSHFEVGHITLGRDQTLYLACHPRGDLSTLELTRLDLQNVEHQFSTKLSQPERVTGITAQNSLVVVTNSRVIRIFDTALTAPRLYKRQMTVDLELVREWDGLLFTLSKAGHLQIYDILYHRKAPEIRSVNDFNIYGDGTLVMTFLDGKGNHYWSRVSLTEPDHSLQGAKDGTSKGDEKSATKT